MPYIDPKEFTCGCGKKYKNNLPQCGCGKTCVTDGTPTDCGQVERGVIRDDAQLFDATDLWNKAVGLGSVYETNAYWKALRDLERLGVVKLSETACE